MAFFQTLYSGSSGNCAVVRDESATLLVDMGKNCKTTLNALYTAGIPANDLDGILVTHEHSDHIAGLAVFLKHYPVPVFGSDRTLEYLYCNRLVPEHADLIPVAAGEEVMIKDLTFSGFRTSHDSVDCFGYRFAFSNGRSAAVATDLGCVDDSVMAAISGCDFVALESNYDEGMLKFGPYPLYLKRRIASPMGHLSNLDSAAAVSALAEAGAARFMLMHLSAENNAPEVALTTCFGILENNGVSCRVDVAPRSTVGEGVAV